MLVMFEKLKSRIGNVEYEIKQLKAELAKVRSELAELKEFLAPDQRECGLTRREQPALKARHHTVGVTRGAGQLTLTVWSCCDLDFPGLFTGLFRAVHFILRTVVLVLEYELLLGV